MQLFSRNENDWTARFAALVEPLRGCRSSRPSSTAKVWRCGTAGKTDFQELQNALKEGRAKRMAYYVFDILYADGYDLTRSAACRAKGISRGQSPAGQRSIVYSKHVAGHGPDYFKNACKMGLEGIISKRRPVCGSQQGAAPIGSKQNAFAERNLSSADSPIPAAAASASAHSCWAITTRDIG